MKMLVAVALIATSAPAVAVAAADSPAASQRLCVQGTTARAGSRMGPRRICRTAAQWQEALGPNWRQRITGRNLEDDLDALAVRNGAVDGSSMGQQGVPFSSTRARGPQ